MLTTLTALGIVGYLAGLGVSAVVLAKLVQRVEDAEKEKWAGVIEWYENEAAKLEGE